MQSVRSDTQMHLQKQECWISLVGFEDLEEQHTNWANEGVFMLHRDDGKTGQRRPCPWGNSTLNCPGPSLASSKLHMHIPHISCCFANDRYRNWLTALAVLTVYRLPSQLVTSACQQQPRPCNDNNTFLLFLAIAMSKAA